MGEGGVVSLLGKLALMGHGRSAALGLTIVRVEYFLL